MLNKTYGQSQVNAVLRLSKEEADPNNPLQSLSNRDYISEKLTAHRQGIIDAFGSSKVPTPVIKDIYKQCKNNVLSSEAKEVPKLEEKKPNITSDFTVQNPTVE